MSQESIKNIYLLDTDTLSLLERGNESIRERIATVPPKQIFVSIITVQEQVEGRLAQIKKAKTVAEQTQAYFLFSNTVRILQTVNLLDYTENVIQKFESLEKMKLNIGKMDMRIGAIALENNAIVATCNQRDYARIPNLSIEDWSV
jgi:tRNA(fMet)-specific endonuclease VapC